MKKMIIIVFALFLVNWANAQTTPSHQHTNNSNAWLMYFGDHKLSDKWGVHLEAQWRRNNWVANPQQLLLRTGINYHFNPQAFATLGYCFVETYPYGEFAAKSTFPEHRIWEQLQLKNQLNRFEWVSRFRLEQRFVQSPVKTGDTYVLGDAIYSNRFRLLNRFSVPFKGKSIVDKSLYASIYDEFFINFGKNVGANYLDQNRAYAAIGYKIPKVGKLELGYLYQAIFKSDGIKYENNHTLQLGLSSTLDFYHKKNN
jgi:hypothetical protein